MFGGYVLVFGMYIDSGILLVLLEFLDISWFVLKFFCNYVMYWLIFFFFDFFISVLFEMKFGVRIIVDERFVIVSVRCLLNFEECLEFVRFFWNGLIVSEVL